MWCQVFVVIGVALMDSRSNYIAAVGEELRYDALSLSSYCSVFYRSASLLSCGAATLHSDDGTTTGPASAFGHYVVHIVCCNVQRYGTYTTLHNAVRLGTFALKSTPREIST